MVIAIVSSGLMSANAICVQVVAVSSARAAVGMSVSTMAISRTMDRNLLVLLFFMW